MHFSADIADFDSAIVRLPSASVVQGLRAEDRGSPTYETVLAEHRAYVAALEAAGLMVQVLEPLEQFPDSIFVEDPALVYTEGAILLYPGAPSRAGETALIAPVLKQRFATVLQIEEGFADGGDVLNLPGTVMIGLSARTTRAGAEALRRCLSALGKHSQIVETPAGVLHLKTDCSLLDDQTILSTARLAGSGIFAGKRVLLTPPGEEAAANALRVNEIVLVGAGFPRTRAMLAENGYKLVALETGEIGKIDAGLSCMSLRWKSQGAEKRLRVASEGKNRSF
jgi:dimethylargininase